MYIWSDYPVIFYQAAFLLLAIGLLMALGALAVEFAWNSPHMLDNNNKNVNVEGNATNGSNTLENVNVTYLDL